MSQPRRVGLCEPDRTGLLSISASRGLQRSANRGRLPQGSPNGTLRGTRRGGAGARGRVPARLPVARRWGRCSFALGAEGRSSARGAERASAHHDVDRLKRAVPRVSACVAASAGSRAPVLRRGPRGRRSARAMTRLRSGRSENLKLSIKPRLAKRAVDSCGRSLKS